MATPAVSVCIPTFNAARHIRDTIGSVLAQTRADFELVICDDASTDDTLEVLGEFTDPRIRVLPGAANTGLAPNWNRVVRECRAPYTKLLCQDDLIYPECLAKQVAILSDPAHADVNLVTAPRDIIDDSGRTRIRARAQWPEGSIPGPSAVRRIVRSGTNPVGEPAAVLFRAEAFHRTGGFRDAHPYMIDVDFWCRALRDANLYCVRETLAAFRVSSTALTPVLAASQSRQAREFFSGLAAEPDSPVTRSDARIGCLKATLLAPTRRLAYRIFGK
jgi:glycosyltransferase involved in cell wall biosynthesis